MTREEMIAIAIDKVWFANYGEYTESEILEQASSLTDEELLSFICED